MYPLSKQVNPKKSVAARNHSSSPCLTPDRNTIPFSGRGWGGRDGERWPEELDCRLEQKVLCEALDSGSATLVQPPRRRCWSQATLIAALAFYLALKVSLEAESSKFARPLVSSHPPGRSWDEAESCFSLGLSWPPSSSFGPQ